MLWFLIGYQCTYKSIKPQIGNKADLSDRREVESTVAEEFARARNIRWALKVEIWHKLKIPKRLRYTVNTNWISQKDVSLGPTVSESNSNVKLLQSSSRMINRELNPNFRYMETSVIGKENIKVCSNVPLLILSPKYCCTPKYCRLDIVTSLREAFIYVLAEFVR